MRRREFFQSGGALIVAFSLLPGALAQEGKKPPLPGSLKDSPLLDSWIRIGADGRVTVFTGKAELGQGIKTALIQLAAEELAVDPGVVAIVTADTATTPNEGYTAGSHSMQDSGTAIRNAAAQAREILIGIAAKRLGTAPGRLQARDGGVGAPDGGLITYGDLVAGEALHVSAQMQSKLTPPGRHAVIGKSTPRVDIPSKVTGGASYVHDLRPPGMAHARVVPPPAEGAKLVSADVAAAGRMPGVLKVVRDGSFLGVIAGREWQAIQAMRALALSAKWEEGKQLPKRDELYSALLGLKTQDTVIHGGATQPAFAGRTVEAEYRKPYQMHGAIGPSCAVARLEGGSVTVWTHSQGVYPLRNALAEMLKLPKESVHCIHLEGSGCYGHNGADDVAADAALLARALPGRPVRVQWMREHEHAGEPYGPAMVTSARASLDSAGRIAAWQYEVWSNTHSTRPGAAGNLAAAQRLATPFTPPPPRAIPQPEGGGDRNAIPLYRIPDARVVHHFIPEMPLRVSALRSLGAYMNVFSIESFMDELAKAAGADPVEFRLRHLEDARARDVIRAAAERFGWSSWRPQPGRGRGFAFARYKNLAAYCAVALAARVDRDSGRVHVERAVAATDSGEAVNPDGIRNQVEGGIVQSLSWTLFESVSFDRRRVTSRDWAGYPILRFPGVPDAVEVVVVDRPGEPFLGTGEAAQGPAAAALANAIADASGARIRELPLGAERVKAALEA